MYRWTTTFLCLLLLSACAQRQVFLTTQGVEPQKLSNLEQQLQTLGWQVTKTKISIPAGFAATTIALNPAQQQQEHVDQVIGLLAQLGFSKPETYKFAEGSHFYSIDSMGLYIRGSHAAPQPPNWLRSDDCATGDTLLSFGIDGNVTLEHEPLNTELEQLNKYHGKWTFDDVNLNVTLTEGEQHFIRSDIMRKTWRGMHPAQLFTPQKEVDFLPLNCSFIIIEME